MLYQYYNRLIYKKIKYSSYIKLNKGSTKDDKIAKKITFWGNLQRVLHSN